MERVRGVLQPQVKSKCVGSPSHQKMASTEEKAELETKTEKAASPPPPPPKDVEAPPPPKTEGADLFLQKFDVVLRVLLFAATLTSLLVMVTSKETRFLLTPFAPTPVAVEAKFDQSPAFIYFVVALALTSLYSFITTVASISAIFKHNCALKLLIFLLLTDVVILGLMSSAMGTAGGVAYIGLKGNSHAQWGKVCPTFTKYCRHLGASIAVSLFAAFLLLLLIFLSLFSLHKKIHN